jgi:hypothetical protein
VAVVAAAAVDTIVDAVVDAVAITKTDITDAT